MFYIGLHYFFERQHARAAVHNRQHIDRERGLQLGMLKEVVQHHLGISVAFYFNHQAHTASVRLIADIGNIGNFFIAHQTDNAFNKSRFVYLIRNSRYDNGFAAVFAFFNFRRGLYFYTAVACFKIFVNTFCSADNSTRGEVRPLDNLHHFLGGNIGVLDVSNNAVADFAQVMRRNIGSHTYGNTGRTVDEQSRKFCRQYGGFH